jgi:hypothetical protein
MLLRTCEVSQLPRPQLADTFGDYLRPHIKRFGNNQLRKLDIS